MIKKIIFTKLINNKNNFFLTNIIFNMKYNNIKKQYNLFSKFGIYYYYRIFFNYANRFTNFYLNSEKQKTKNNTKKY